MTVTNIASKYFTVTTRDSRRQVEAYLYNHSEIVAEVVTPATGSDGGRAHFLIRTCAEGDKAEERARYLAEYQAERLASGMYFTGPVGDHHQVTADHLERCGVNLIDPPATVSSTWSA